MPDDMTLPRPGRQVHLICNAHLDPVWLWEWEEGAAEALSTFRTAAELCEVNGGFIFCHNEVILYEWIEAYEPALFERIRRLADQGRWHIMGGWFLQPDCNMPSGESFLRQIQIGRRYFGEKFGQRPTTAINFDSFGHTRGLVQIMAQCGFDSYLVCRPQAAYFEGIPCNQFVWRGFEGSEVLVSRAPEFYNSPLGRAREKVENHIARLEGRSAESHHAVGAGTGQEGPRSARSAMHVLWGVGNHGGGPSRKDVADLNELIAAANGRIRHSTPEAFFAALRESGEELPVADIDINRWAIGCYTSQMRIKQLHRRLENALFSTEKLAANACLSGFKWPAESFRRAERDLCTAQFHDILPGSSVQPVEEYGIRILMHGLEEVARVRAAARFHLARGLPRARDGEIPIIVANPHPFEVETEVACEFNLPDQNWDESIWTAVEVYQGRRRLESQTEQELSSLNLDWRKRVVCRARLAPSGLTQLTCRLKPKKTRRDALPDPGSGGLIRLGQPGNGATVNIRTGLLEALVSKGKPVLSRRALEPVLMRDSPDPWEVYATSFTRRAGAFKRMTAAQAAEMAGVEETALPPVRMIEHGAVRSVVESMHACQASRLVMHLAAPRDGSHLDLGIRVLWNATDRMLKLRIPWHPSLGAPRVLGQTAFGTHQSEADGRECVAQKWIALEFPESNMALTVINDGTYGFHVDRRALYLSLLRSPVYAAHPLPGRVTLPQDRYLPRCDQGAHLFRFRLQAGPTRERLDKVSREADVFNEAPDTVSFFPSGNRTTIPGGLRVTGNIVQLSAFRKLEAEDACAARLFNPTPRPASCEVILEPLGIRERIRLPGMSFRTYRLDRTGLREISPEIA
jgi:alpha-mannosidase